MAINYPANPTNGQTFGQYIYDASIPGWRNVNSSEGIGLQFKSGLIPVVPTSVTVGSGTASVATDGTVTFSGASLLTVNGVFSSSYSTYRLIMDGSVSSDSGVGLRMDNFSTASYTWQWGRFYGSTAQVINSTADSKFYVSSGDTDGISFIADVFSPNKVAKTSTVFQGFGSSGVDFAYLGSGQLATTTQYTGLSLLANTGNISGTIKVYGYN